MATVGVKGLKPSDDHQFQEQQHITSLLAIQVTHRTGEVCCRRDVLRVQQLHGAVQFRQVGRQHQQQRVPGSLYYQVLHSTGRG